MKNPWHMSNEELSHLKSSKTKEAWEEQQKKKWNYIDLLLLPSFILLSPVILITYIYCKLGEMIEGKPEPLPRIKTKEERLLEENMHLRSQNEKLLQRVGQEGIYR